MALPAPKIIDSAAAFPGGKFNVENMINGVADPKRGSEYATDSQGTGTFIDFDFGKPAVIAAFKHIDRFDIANVDAAELIFSAEADFRKVTATVGVDHVGTRGGTTLVAFPPVTARYVRWRVTALATHNGVTHQTVGGSEIGFFMAAEPDSAPMRTTLESEVDPALVNQNEKLSQPFRITIRYPYAQPAEAILKMPGGEEKRVKLKLGSQSVEGFAPVVKYARTATCGAERPSVAKKRGRESFGLPSRAGLARKIVTLAVRSLGNGRRGLGKFLRCDALSRCVAIADERFVPWIRLTRRHGLR